MNGRIGVLLVAGALLAGGAPVRAERFMVSGHGMWLDVGGNVEDGIGYAFKGHAGVSVEAGIRILDNVWVGGEYSPYTTMPVRSVPEGEGIEEGAYKYSLGQITVRMEPIEKIVPFLIGGAGLSRWRNTYSGAGKLFDYMGQTHLLKEESVEATTFMGGIGFLTPLRPWLSAGFRARYLYNRWQSVTDVGRPLSYPKGDAFAVDLHLSAWF
jgi:hypothetical protein